MSNCNCGYDIGDPRVDRHSDKCSLKTVAKLKARIEELEAELVRKSNTIERLCTAIFTGEEQ